MCQGFNHFVGFLHHFVLAKLNTSSTKVKREKISADKLVQTYINSKLGTREALSMKLMGFLEKEETSMTTASCCSGDVLSWS